MAPGEGFAMPLDVQEWRDIITGQGGYNDLCHEELVRKRK